MSFVISCSHYCLYTHNTRGKSIQYYNGKMFQVSEGRNSIVAVSLKKQSRNMGILIGVINTGSNSMVVSSNMVSGYYERNQQSNPLRVYSDNQWLRKVRRQQVAAGIAQGISQGVEAANAGRTTTNVSATAHGSGGYGYVYGTATTYDHSKKTAVRRQHQIERDEMNRRFQSDMHNIRNRLLRTNTLFPGQNISGVVMARYVNSDLFKFSVNCGSEIHRFEFRIQSGRCR